MNSLQLQKGIALSQQIADVAKELDKWKRGSQIPDGLLRIKVSDNQTECVKTDLIDFNVIKAIAVAKLESQLQLLKEEFEKL